jgi:hypothetical protein
MRMADVMYTATYSTIYEDMQCQQLIKFQMAFCATEILHLFILPV